MTECTCRAFSEGHQLRSKPPAFRFSTKADHRITVRTSGAYRYDASRIRDAHAWCQYRTREALALGRRVVVSNTFTRLQEMEPYRSMTSSIRIIEATGR